jgi:hypothetical protein
MARDYFLDLQESGGDWWLEGWRCINCGHVYDPVVEKNRQMHAAAVTATEVRAPLSLEPVAEGDQDHSIDLAA